MDLDISHDDILASYRQRRLKQKTEGVQVNIKTPKRETKDEG